MIIFGTCIGNQEKYDWIDLPSIRKVAAPDDVILTRTGQSGICKPYNEFILEARRRPDCEALVLLHEDAEILDPDFRAKALTAVKDPTVGVAGLIGGSGLRDQAWWHARRRTGLVYETRQAIDLGPRRGDVDVVDGLLVVLSPAAFNTVLFDEANFPRFHGCECDYCLQVRDRGLRVIVTDIDVLHRATNGARDEKDWEAVGLVMAQKWPAWVRRPYPGWQTQRSLTDAGKRLVQGGRRRALVAARRPSAVGLAGKVHRRARRARTSEELADIAMNETFMGMSMAVLQRKDELAGFARLVERHRPRTVLEIGTAGGGTLFVLCQASADDSTLISLDLPRGPFGGGYPPWRATLYRRFARRGQTVHLLLGNSHFAGTAAKIAELLDGRPLDLLFIDGDHTYEGVSRDFADYSPLVGQGSLIVFHDVNPGPPENVGGVPRFWEEISPRFESHTITTTDGGESYGIGVIALRRTMAE
jgi:predicted O-methyltransferase YrrM